MVTTAAGLIIGIPALVAYNWLNGRADRIIFDLEFYSSKVLDTLRRRQVEPAGLDGGAAASDEVPSGEEGPRPDHQHHLV